MAIIKKISEFLIEGIWLIPSKELSKAKYFLVKHLRILILAIKGFFKDNCSLQASALTFYVLLSIVPLVAMLFGIAKGFGFEKILETRLYEKMEGQEEVAIKIVEFAKSFLEHTQGGIIAGVGVLVLFFTTIKLLSNVESAFNNIWGIKKSRSLVRKVSDYLSLLLICPVLIISSSSFTFIATRKLSEFINFLVSIFPLLSNLEFLIFFVIKLIPYLVLWILFTFIYVFIPNTKVKFYPAFMAGIIAGTLFQIMQWLYINFQLFLSSYGTIYGSFSALPLFLVWLQLSWIILLFGAQIAFAFQNVDLFEFEPNCLKLSKKIKNIISLGILNLIIKNFRDSKHLTNENISRKLNIPIKLVNELLHNLTEANILAETNTKPSCFVPKKPLEEFSIVNVLKILDENGLNELPFKTNSELNKIITLYSNIFKENIYSKDNILIENI